MQQLFHQHNSEILSKGFEHLYTSGLALTTGIIIVAPLSVLLTRSSKATTIVIGLTNALQAIPPLALLALMIPLSGVGKLPAIITLFIYSLLPILRNTHIGAKDIDRNCRDVTRRMGVTKFQSIFFVELPIVTPTIMAGTRLIAAYVIVWATLASYIGAGGLGGLIFSGLNNYQPDLTLADAIPVTALALLIDWPLDLLEHRLAPIALREKNDE